MKTNYQIILDETLKKLDKKEKLLLHSCCGPCSSYVLEYLCNYFDITVLYYNPNIYPFNEYEKRLHEQIKLINELNNNKIKEIDLPYDHDDFIKNIKGHENDKEGGIRCHLCYKFRLEKTAEYAKNNNYDYFSTTLTVSPYKDSQILNEIGAFLEKKYNIKYLYSDFKKKNGYKRSIELSKKYDLYRQNYCGCEFSINEIDNKK